MFQSSSSPLAGAPDVYQIRPFAGFTRPEIDQQSDPFVLFANVGYQADRTKDCIPLFTTVASAAEKDEPETLMYHVLEDSSANYVRVIEAYQSHSALYDIHFQSAAFEEFRKKNEKLITGERQLLKLKKIDGYFHK